MDEDLFILFEPRIHLIPVKGKMALQCGSIAGRLDVRASSVLCDVIPYGDPPANSSILVRPQLPFFFKMLHSDILNGKPIGRRPLRFIDEKYAVAVSNQLATEVRADPARAAFNVHPFLQPRSLHGRGNQWPRECLSHLDDPSFWASCVLLHL
jgi:hypothetical protein